MIFALFSLAISAAFFVSSLALLNYGRHLGLRYLQGAANMSGLASVEGAVPASTFIAFHMSELFSLEPQDKIVVAPNARGVCGASNRE